MMSVVYFPRKQDALGAEAWDLSTHAQQTGQTVTMSAIVHSWPHHASTNTLHRLAPSTTHTKFAMDVHASPVRFLLATQFASPHDADFVVVRVRDLNCEHEI